MFIIYSQEDNKLGVLFPTNEMSLEETARKDIPAGRPYAFVSSLDIDNNFFNAYEFVEGEITVNIVKAKEIWLEKIRAARVSQLEKLDILFMKALETNNVEEQQEISNKKQTLRDITAIKLPDTLEEIKATWPSILNG